MGKGFGNGTYQLDVIQCVRTSEDRFYEQQTQNRARLHFKINVRGLIGLQSSAAHLSVH